MFPHRFVWTVRRFMKSEPAEGETGDPVIGRFRAEDICNIDQCPIEDEDKDGARRTFSRAG
jgi:hypothetical protein